MRYQMAVCQGEGSELHCASRAPRDPPVVSCVRGASPRKAIERESGRKAVSADASRQEMPACAAMRWLICQSISRMRVDVSPRV